MTWTLPTADTTAGRFARELALLLGPAYGNAPASSNRLDDLMALGYALGYAWQRQKDALDEAHPATAEELLSDLEEEYGLPVDESLPAGARRGLLLAKIRARFEGTPDAMELTALPVAAAQVLEILARDVAHTDPRAVYRLVVTLSAADYGSLTEESDVRRRLRVLLAQQKPAHTFAAFAIDMTGFLCDDAESLTDRDALAS